MIVDIIVQTHTTTAVGYVLWGMYNGKPILEYAYSQYHGEIDMKKLRDHI